MRLAGTALVVGGAGFIGSHLVDALVGRGVHARVFDNLSVGRRAHLEQHFASGAASLVVADALDLEALVAASQGASAVFHLAANPEARWGLENTRLDLEQGTIATYNALEAARRTGVPRFVFASSGTVYGEVERRVAEGDLGALPISLYGASKLAGEAMISAFVEGFDLRATIVRFGNVVGARGTHGAALDFLKRLASDPRELVVLGDGQQAKPYLHVSDCVAGLLHAAEHQESRLGVFNLAPDDTSTVRFIAETCVRRSPHPSAAIRFTGGDRGWRGDVPRSRMDASKLAELGFRIALRSDEAVERAVGELAREVFGDRGAA
ncbi:MAG: NAD-dependent epimerase/dehydratase family protein [Polyangiaceae bacterium]